MADGLHDLGHYFLALEQDRAELLDLFDKIKARAGDRRLMLQFARLLAESVDERPDPLK